MIIYVNDSESQIAYLSAIKNKITEGYTYCIWNHTKQRAAGYFKTLFTAENFLALNKKSKLSAVPLTSIKVRILK